MAMDLMSIRDKFTRNSWQRNYKWGLSWRHWWPIKQIAHLPFLVVHFKPMTLRTNHPNSASPGKSPDAEERCKYLLRGITFMCPAQISQKA